MPESQRPDKMIAARFAWLLDLGFQVVDDLDWGGMSATYATTDVLVFVGYHWKDEEVTISIARRRAMDVREQPHWSYVRLQELLARRAPDKRWAAQATTEHEAQRMFEAGSDFLRQHASDVVAGQNLELLDDIIAGRPRFGVPGLDYKASKPWFASAEGVWMFTDSEMPKSMTEYLDRSHSPDPAKRALAALKIVVAARIDDPADIELGHARLHELLSDPDTDVRRAAGSALGELGDVDALDELLELLDTEVEASPFAAAAAFVAIDAATDVRERVLSALIEFGAKSDSASTQVGQLAWRI